MDKDGNAIWEQTVNTSKEDFINAIDVDAQGKVFAGGHAASSTYGRGAFIIKYDGTTGQQRWIERIDSGTNPTVTELKVDKSGNVHVAGDGLYLEHRFSNGETRANQAHIE
ncbi:hypothetical protein H6G41_23045 [Tolypothrix sp. FACHB-123]|uniref:hypothetical protein n=1 Tax=Tolypothrix sp. FACHB-123 TaxID=2692868 RepID=UPI0016840809|nr:hypothetical protein [Tolypothrix sp. FACHB-123]MBD2357455.1 hypothetical protein [Tolypothrix sp. FACHB-123]